MEVSKNGWGQNRLDRCVAHHGQFHKMRQGGFQTRGNKGTVYVANDVENSIDEIDKKNQGIKMLLIEALSNSGKT